MEKGLSDGLFTFPKQCVTIMRQETYILHNTKEN